MRASTTLKFVILILVAGTIVWAGPAQSPNPRPWPGFRGPAASGVADGQGAPLEWDVATGRSVLWETEIPGASNSSPIVWGDRLFLTTAISGSGTETLRAGISGDIRSLEDRSEHVWHLYSIDTASGNVVWDREVYRGVPGVMRHPKGSQASSTPVTDGERVVVLFGTIGRLAAYDFDGDLIWQDDIGVIDSAAYNDPNAHWGHSSSPIIYDDMVIVQADGQQDPFIAAYALEDGRQIWKTDRGEDLSSWGTPAIASGPAGDELIANGTVIRGYDPRTGEERWSLGPNSYITIPTPVVGPDLVYVTGGYQPIRPIYALRPGGRGDISPGAGEKSDGAVRWSTDRDGPYIPTPLLYRNLLYVLRINGVLAAYDADTGEEIYRVRVGTGTFTASPVASDGRIYVANEDGQVFVVAAGEEYEELAVNEMGSMIMATPAISGGRMYIRALNSLFAVGSE